jgi:hypothetical protein
MTRPSSSMWAAQSLAHFDVDHRRPKMSYDPVRNWNHVAAQPGRKSITLIQIDKSVIYQPSITVNFTGKPVVLIGGAAAARTRRHRLLARQIGGRPLVGLPVLDGFGDHRSRRYHA